MTLDVYSGLFDDGLGALTDRMDLAHEAQPRDVTVRSVGTVWARDPVVKIDDQASTL